MCLARGLGISYSLFQDVFGLLYELPMQVNCVPVHSTHGIVLSEDIVRRLLVVLVCELGVVLGLL